MGPHIDIGAHETNLGWRYLLTLTGPSSCVPVGTNATVTASVFDAVANSAAAGVQVSISVQGGTIVSVNGVSVGAQTATGTTDSNGNVTILVSRSTWGMLTVTVMVPGSESLTKTVSACFYDSSAAPVEIFFCLDCTESMWGNGEDHGAQASVEGFLSDMTNTYGVQFRVGGIKFNNPYEGDGTDSIETDSSGNPTARVFTSLSGFQSVAGFDSWVDNGYDPSGGDSPELQLDALHYAAQDMDAYSTPNNPNRYIVLITDNTYHYANDPYGPYPGDVWPSNLTVNGVASELTSSGCQVYISLWEDAYHNDYTNLVVNGGQFDPSNSAGTDQEGNWKYPLDNLRARILGQ